MSNQYQALEIRAVGHQHEGTPFADVSQIPSQPIATDSVQVESQLHCHCQPPVHHAIPIGMPENTTQAQPLVVPSYPASQTIQPLSRDVILSMPAVLGCKIRLFVAILVAIWAALTVVTMGFFLPPYLGFMWAFFPFFGILLFSWKVPRRCEISQYGVTVYTGMTNHLLPFSRMTSIHVIRSTCCWTKDCGTFAFSPFTSTTNCVLFRGDACRTSIGFSPFDIEQFVHVLQQTATAQKIVHE